MAAATYDEGVQDLAAFNGLVAQVCGTLRDEVASLQEERAELETLGRDTTEALGDLREGLDDARDRLAAAQEESAASLEGLSDLADDLSTRVVETLVADLDSAAADLDHAREVSAREQGDAFGRLESDGFGVQDQAAAACEATVDDATTESDEAFATLGSGLDGEAAILIQAGTDLEAVLDGAGADADEAAGVLAAEGEAATGQWLAATDGPLEAASQSVADAVAAGFDTFGDEAATTADGLADAAKAALERVERAVRDDVDAPVTEALAALEEGPQQTLLQELDATRAAFEGAVPLADGLVVITPELRIGLRVVAQVDELLQALA